MNGIRVFCRLIYFHLRSKIFSSPLTGRGAIVPMDPPLRLSICVRDWETFRTSPLMPKRTIRIADEGG